MQVDSAAGYSLRGAVRPFPRMRKGRTTAVESMILFTWKLCALKECAQMPRQEVDCGSTELCQLSFVFQNYHYCMYWIRESCAGFEGKTGAAVLMVQRLLWDPEGPLLTHILWSTGSLVQPGALPSGSPQPEPGTCVQAASFLCRSKLEALADWHGFSFVLEGFGVSSGVWICLCCSLMHTQLFSWPQAHHHSV